MNGHIDVQSEVNKGSRFTAVLPYLNFIPVQAV